MWIFDELDDEAIPHLEARKTVEKRTSPKRLEGVAI